MCYNYYWLDLQCLMKFCLNVLLQSSINACRIANILCFAWFWDGRYHYPCINLVLISILQSLLIIDIKCCSGCRSWGNYDLQWIWIGRILGTALGVSLNVGNRLIIESSCQILSNMENIIEFFFEGNISNVLGFSRNTIYRLWSYD